MATPIICLMGPTAAGKTPLALELAAHFPCDIISVDSALVYKDMDIGTAKPDAEILARVPHALVDICDAKEAYSAGQFHQDAVCAIKKSQAQNRLPLLVGGTMLYFRTLLQGLSALPAADEALRQQLATRAEIEGWPALHAELSKIDPAAAARIKPMDKQRIQRALEVFYMSGKPISEWQTENVQALDGQQVHWLAIMPQDRAALHARIEKRFEDMLAQGFVAEVEKLKSRGDLNPDMPSQRAVGYRQAWAYLNGEIDYETFKQQAIAATRQLAKRQLTWLRRWPCELKIDIEQNAKIIDFIKVLF